MSELSGAPTAAGGAQATGRLPTFLIVGAQKSGTTLLAALLDAHPQASCALEPHFFRCNFDRGEGWYRSHFTGTTPVVGEKTPEYLHHSEAPARMAAVVPEAKLIAILRDPVARAYSHYWHRRRTGRERASFEEAIEGDYNASGERVAGYLDRGRYLEQLQRLHANFPSGSILVTLFEDLRDRPDETFARVCRFIGIDDSSPPEKLPVANPYRDYRPEWLWRNMYRYRLWKRLPRSWASALGRWMTREREFAPLDPETRGRLAATFAPDNEALARWLGRDLSEWRWPAGS